MEAKIKIRALWDHLRTAFEATGKLDEIFALDSESAARNLRFSFYNKRKREAAKDPDDPFIRAVYHAIAEVYEEDGEWRLRIRTNDPTTLRVVASARDEAILEGLDWEEEKIPLVKPRSLKKGVDI